MKKNIAIIGLGRMGERYCNLINKEKKYRIIAICDKDNKKLIKNSKKFKVKNTFLNYKKLLNSKIKINLVIVSTTANYHASITQYSIINKYKNILIEKPVCNSIKDCFMLVKLKNKFKPRVSVNHVRRFSKNYTLVKNILKKGLIGRPISINIQMGGGQIGSNGVHLIDLAIYLLGDEPKYVNGFINKTKLENPRGKKFFDPGGFGIIIFKNKARAFIDIMEDHSSPVTLLIIGSKGRIFYDEKQKKFTLFTRPKKNFNSPIGQRIKFKKKIIKCEKLDISLLSKKNIDNLFSKNKIVAPLENGIKSLEIASAFHISNSKNNQKIKLPISKKYYAKKYKFA